MESTIESVIEFIRVRHLNIAIAGVLTIAYILYQYWPLLVCWQQDDPPEESPKLCRSRSRSKSHSRSRTRTSVSHDYRPSDYKYNKRNRKPQRRCPNCEKCIFDP